MLIERYNKWLAMVNGTCIIIRSLSADLYQPWKGTSESNEDETNNTNYPLHLHGGPPDLPLKDLMSHDDKSFHEMMINKFTPCRKLPTYPFNLNWSTEQGWENYSTSHSTSCQCREGPDLVCIFSFFFLLW